MLATAPLGAQAADLAEEDQAVREVIAAFEQGSGKHVELVLGPRDNLVADLLAAIRAGRETPDFIYTVAENEPYERWVYEGRLVDLTDAVGHFSDLFDADALQRATLLDGTTNRRGLYLLPMGLGTHYVHVWKSLLERAGFTLADIPKEWDAFWSFWCDEVQPAARKALGRDDIWGTGISLSAASVDTQNGIWQFIHAYEADYVTSDGKLVIDDPEIRRRLIKALDSYTALYRRVIRPISRSAPSSWTTSGNGPPTIGSWI
jgi:multiple sugar transport system substrate-binding protein